MKKFSILILLICVLIFVGCSNKKISTETNIKNNTKKLEATKEVTETQKPIDEQQVLSDAYNFSVEKIWNEGLCDISHYIESGTNSNGEKMDPQKVLSNLESNMKTLEKYNKSVSEIKSDKHSDALKQWKIIYDEANKLFKGLSVDGTKITASYKNFDKFTDAQSELCNIIYADLLKENN